MTYTQKAVYVGYRINVKNKLAHVYYLLEGNEANINNSLIFKSKLCKGSVGCIIPISVVDKSVKYNPKFVSTERYYDVEQVLKWQMESRSEEKLFGLEQERNTIANTDEFKKLFKPIRDKLCSMNRKKRNSEILDIINYLTSNTL